MFWCEAGRRWAFERQADGQPATLRGDSASVKEANHHGADAEENANRLLTIPAGGGSCSTLM
jgi:hypothetical protein